MVAPTKDAAGHVEGYEIFIKYLPQEATASELKAWFGEAGEIVGDVRLMTNPQTGKCKGIGWITFATEAGHAQAMSWDGSEYGGRRLAISSATKQHTGFRPSVQAPGTHTPAMLHEVIKAMVAPDPAGVYVDATFGRGGHTRGILGALSPAGSAAAREAYHAGSRCLLESAQQFAFVCGKEEKPTRAARELAALCMRSLKAARG